MKRLLPSGSSLVQRHHLTRTDAYVVSAKDKFTKPILDRIGLGYSTAAVAPHRFGRPGSRRKYDHVAGIHRTWHDPSSAYAGLSALCRQRLACPRSRHVFGYIDPDRVSEPRTQRRCHPSGSAGVSQHEQMEDRFPSPRIRSTQPLPSAASLLDLPTQPQQPHGIGEQILGL